MMQYQLMRKDEEVVLFDVNFSNFTVINQQFLPIGIQNGMTLENWLKQRRADRSRVSVRKLFATLKMNFGDDEYISGFRKPTDFWWVKASDSNEKFDAKIEDLHLITLNLASIVPASPRNFEVANIGSYEKGWRENHLLKSGNLNEIFSEMLYARISKLYMPPADYKYEKIKGRNFVSSPNSVDQAQGCEYLVLADEWTGTGPEEMFEDWFLRFKDELDGTEIESMKTMHFLDIVLNNFDRHCQNFGFVYYDGSRRNFAPNFDFNLSIAGYNGLENLGQNEIRVEKYFELFNEIPSNVKQMPDIDWLKQQIKEVTTEIGLDYEKYSVVASWIVSRWEQLI